MRLRSGEVAGLRHEAHGLLRDPAAAGGDLGGEARILGRVDHIHAPRLHRDRPLPQRRRMGLGIDAAGEARDDDIARLAQRRGELARHAQPEARGVARPHQRDHGPRQKARIALQPEKGEAHRRSGRGEADSPARRARASRRLPRAPPPSPSARRAAGRPRSPRSRPPPPRRAAPPAPRPPFRARPSAAARWPAPPAASGSAAAGRATRPSAGEEMGFCALARMDAFRRCGGRARAAGEEVATRPGAAGSTGLRACGRMVNGW